MVTWTVHGHFDVRTRRDVAFLAQSPLNRVRRRIKKKKKASGSLAVLSSGGQKDAEGCAILGTPLPTSQSAPASRSCAQPGIGLSQALPGIGGWEWREVGGIEALETRVFLTPSLRVSHCAHPAAPCEGRFPRIQSALSAPHSCPSLNALPALSSYGLSPQPSSFPWLPLRTPVPSPQPPPHPPHLTFATSPTRDPLSPQQALLLPPSSG